MNIIGLDLSLTGTGICTAGDGCLITTSLTGVERLHRLWLDICSELPDRPAVVVLEGYSYGSKGRAVFDIGELGGVVRHELYTSGYRFVVVPPSTLKKFATGKGNIGKDAMVATAARLGCPYDDNNIIDAWWLRQMGLYRYALPDVGVTAYRDEAVHTVDWPEL